MMYSTTQTGLHDILVWVRFGGDSRLHCVTIDHDALAQRSDIVLVRNQHDDMRAARIVGEHRDSEADRHVAGRVVAGYNIDPLSSTLLSDLVDRVPSDWEPGRSHRWGALGLPEGLNTAVTPARSSLPADDVYAVESSGYRESRGERLHQLVPGDVTHVRGSEVTIAMIDRRNDRIELVNTQDEATLEMPLHTFIEEEGHE